MANNNYKDAKQIMPQREFDFIQGTYDYDITGFDKTKAIVFSREENSIYKQMESANYTFVDQSNTLLLRITNNVFATTIESIQICYANDTAPAKVADNETDIRNLVPAFNQTVDSLTETIEYMKNLLIFTDTTTFTKQLPVLGDNQTWAYNAIDNEFYAIDVVDLAEAIAKAKLSVDEYVKSDVEPHLDSYGKTVVNNEFTSQLPTELAKIDTHVQTVAIPNVDTHTENTDGKGVKLIDSTTATGVSTIDANLRTALNTLQTEADRLAQNQGVAPTDFDFHALSNADGRYYTPVLPTYKNAPTFQPGETIANTLIESFKDTNGDIQSRTVTVKTGANTYVSTYDKSTGVWSTWISELEAAGLIIPVPDSSIYTTPMAVSLIDQFTDPSGLPFKLTELDKAADGILIPGVGGNNTVGLYYAGEVKFTGTGIDDLGNALVDEEYYFKSNTKVGGIQRTKPTGVGEIFQVLFRVGHVAPSAGDDTIILVEVGTAIENSTDVFTTGTSSDSLVVKSQLDSAVGDLNSLHTTEKSNVVGAINEIKDAEWERHYHHLGSTTVSTDLNTIIESGLYRSDSVNNIFENAPVGAMTSCVLTVDQTQDTLVRQKYEPRESTDIYVRYLRGTDWSEWSKLKEDRTLDSRIVGLVDPWNGDWTDVEMRNQNNLGNGATEGDLTCVINEKTYVGQGYTNIGTGVAYKTNATYTIETPTEYKFTKTEVASGMNLNLYIWKPNTDYFVSMKIKGGISVFKLGSDQPHTITKETKDGDYYSVLFRTGNVRDTGEYLDITATIQRQIGEEFHVYEFMVVEGTTSEHPFVQNSIADGRLVIDKPYNRNTHSFITVGSIGTPSYSIIPIATDIGYAKERYTIVNPANPTNRHDSLISSSYMMAFEGTAERPMTVEESGILGDIVSLTGHGNGKNQYHTSFQYCAIYEGDLTEAEMKRELALLKSGNFEVPRSLNTNARETIPYAIGANGVDTGNTVLYDAAVGTPGNMTDIITLQESIYNFDNIEIAVGEYNSDNDSKIIPTYVIAKYPNTTGLQFTYYDNNGGAAAIQGGLVHAVIKILSYNTMQIVKAFANGVEQTESTYLRIRRVVGMNRK